MIRASIGIAISGARAGTRAGDAGELIRNADAAMYICKRDGQGGYRVFESAMHERVLERLELRAELQRAIDEHELELHYQPVIGLARRARDRHGGARPLAPSDARVRPARAVHPAGRGDGPDRRARPLGAARVVPAAWPDAREPARSTRDFMLGVNLSVKQLQHPDIVADVERGARGQRDAAGDARARDHRDA